MDHNEHVYDEMLGKTLSNRNGLNLQELILKQTGIQTGATFFRGSQPIDGLWVSDDLDISNACVMPFGYGVGDHRPFVLDIPLQSLIGVNPVRIIRPASRRLNSRLPGCGKAYVRSLEGKYNPTPPHRTTPRSTHGGIFRRGASAEGYCH